MSSNTTVNRSAESVDEGDAISPLDQRLTPWMWGITQCYFLFLAGLLHLHDRPEYASVFAVCMVGVALLHPIYWWEALLRWRRGEFRGAASFWCCVLPPLRIGVRDVAHGCYLWLPGWGWCHSGYNLARRLERTTSIPMVVLALLVLPVIAAEHFWWERYAADPVFSGLLAGVTGLIWWAFAVELIVMMGATDRRMAYLKSHWLDVVVVLLPLAAFLRALQIGRILRVQQMVRATQVYRLRSVSTRGWRALLLIDVVQRLLAGSRRRQLAALREQLRHRELELDELRQQILRLEGDLAAGANEAQEGGNQPAV